MKTQLLLLCAVLALCGTPTPLQAGTWNLSTLPSGLVAWWPADGTAADASPNHLDGALSGGAGYTNGWAGSAFAFDGATGCAIVPDSPALRLTNALTIEFWARRQRWDIDIVLEKGGDWNTAVGGEANYGVGLHTVNNRMFYFFFRGGWRGTSGVNDLNWHHYAVVATNGAANPVLYIDGVARPIEFAEGAAVLNLYASTRPLHIGAQVFPGWNYYGNNVLDDVRLYSRGLRADEIVLLHAGPPPDGLLSWWRGEGDTADALGQHHGTAQGGLGYAAGQLGQAFALDGTSGAVALGNWFNLQQFTLSLWVKPAPAQVQFADLLDNNHTGSRSWVFERVNSPEPADWLWHAGPDAELFFQLATNRWQHLVVSRDTNGVSRLYLEGRPAGSVTNGGPISYDGTQFLWLGRWGAGGRYFNGLVDELMVFDRPLSADEVAWLHGSQGGRPRLDIQPGPGTVQLSWPLGTAAYRLEAATDLQSGNWATVTNVVVSSPTRFNLFLPPDGATRFFRLRKP